MKYPSEALLIPLAGPLERFSMRVWQNARVNNVRRAIMCDVYFPFLKILELY